MYYEIEYGSCSIPGVGKFVQKPQKIEAPAVSPMAEPGFFPVHPENDEIRSLFDQMRDIAREHRSTFDYWKIFDRRSHHNNAVIFYKQGLFMKDFADDYTGGSPFSQYFPYYQMMGYEQLRTYFSWRTEVRKRNVSDISLSYAFLYIYELLGNIGASGPEDSLDKLMYFWKAFRVYNNSIDKYVLRWLKDYHIYYELSHSFKEFIENNSLADHYPGISVTEDNFELFCSVSKYDIRKSTFYSGEYVQLVKDCFYIVEDNLRQAFIDNGIHFDESIFRPTRKMVEWKPFKDALFYEWVNQGDRRVILSEKEIYICSNNKWTSGRAITSESGRQLIGYIVKQMEVDLRKVTNYKFKLSANIDTVPHEVAGKLKESGLSLEMIISGAVARFYKEVTKTVVRVDHEVLSRIREEALATQDMLSVPDEEDMAVTAATTGNPGTHERSIKQPDQGVESNNAWAGLKEALTCTEIKALSMILNEEAEVKKYADECGIMLEVLIDGINEKAMDLIGDSILDEEFIIYDDYIEQLRGLMVWV